MFMLQFMFLVNFSGYFFGKYFVIGPILQLPESEVEQAHGTSSRLIFPSYDEQRTGDKPTEHNQDKQQTSGVLTNLHGSFDEKCQDIV